MINTFRNIISDIEQKLEQFDDTEFALLITASKDKEGNKRDGLVVVGRIDELLSTTVFKITDNEDLETLFIGAAGMYISERESLREIGKIVEL